MRGTDAAHPLMPHTFMAPLPHTHLILSCVTPSCLIPMTCPNPAPNQLSAACSPTRILKLTCLPTRILKPVPDFGNNPEASCTTPRVLAPCFQLRDPLPRWLTLAPFHDLPPAHGHFPPCLWSPSFDPGPQLRELAGQITRDIYMECPNVYFEDVACQESQLSAIVPSGLIPVICPPS